jgi:uncharacterized protein (UPF0332 family)
MRLNHKQEELIAQLAREIEEKFPDIRFVEVVPSPESTNTLWLEFTKPADDDRFIEVGEYASERTTDILLDYGYHFVVLPSVANGKSVALANQSTDSSRYIQWEERFMSYQNWLNKANENLAAAQLCFDHNHFNACANRLYHAMFQAGAAVLIKNGVFPPKEQIGHDWPQANFSGQLIHRRKLFPANFRSYLSDAYWVRIRADYRLLSVSKKVAASELKKAKEFINAINLEVSNATQSQANGAD